MSLFSRLFPSRNDRLLKDYFSRANQILALESDFQQLDDGQLLEKFQECQQRHQDGTSLDDLLVDVFAITREVCDRRLGIWNVFNTAHKFNWKTAPQVMREAAEACQQARQENKSPFTTHLPAAFYQSVREQYPESRPPFRMQSFSTQLMGGMVLHEGKIAEMRTGEGKTLTAVNSVILNSIADQVFVVTVNDYLARRDAAWMAPAYVFLGLSCGSLQSNMPPRDRQAVYGCNIVYGTNSEFGFDYLRDNMATSPEQQVQKKRAYAVVDEVDSVLIDEARTPLIISGQPDAGQTPYDRANEVAKYLKVKEHFEIEEKHKSAALSEQGVTKCEEILGIENMYSGRNIEWPHLIENAIRAHNLYQLDRDYVVAEDPESNNREIVIVDEFTGRLQHGRRWGDGLHQAIESKEGLDTREESITLATVTIQNYFRMFDRLAGMTGTAFTEAQEFYQIYSLDVVVIPTHRPMVRVDSPDLIYGTYEAKCKAIIREVVELSKQGRPVLVGTTSVSKSEELSHRLNKKGIAHQVLNAKHHAKEAEIIASAGQKSSVTIATNMAGRGTDIVLGEGVAEAGGLHIIGTERHESRRIDNQLRGRAGRQGDNGSSRFYLSLEDELIRVFANDWMRQMMQKGLPEDENIESKMVTRSIARAQKRVEEHNFGIRKNLIEYDDVKNEQRKLVYEERQEILNRNNLKEMALNLVKDDFQVEAENCLGGDFKAVDRDPQPFVDYCHQLGLDFQSEDTAWTTVDVAVDAAQQVYRKQYEELETRVGEDNFQEQIAYLLLYKLDNKWKDHLQEMDRLRSSIGLMGYAQMDPKIAYKKEGFQLFDQMLQSWSRDVTALLLKIEPPPEEDLSNDFFGLEAETVAVHEEFSEKTQLKAAEQGKTAPQVKQEVKIPRNSPCPCGSGKKYKQCHGVQS